MGRVVAKKRRFTGAETSLQALNQLKLQSISN